MSRIPEKHSRGCAAGASPAQPMRARWLIGARWAAHEPSLTVDAECSIALVRSAQ
jgi:hypothetical protein